MTGLTENQRGIILMVSLILTNIAATQIPADLPNSQTWKLILGIASVAAIGLQKFLQADPAEQQTVLDSLHGFAQVWSSMTSEQQTKLIQELPTILPLLSSAGTTLAPKP